MGNSKWDILSVTSNGTGTFLLNTFLLKGFPSGEGEAKGDATHVHRRHFTVINGALTKERGFCRQRERGPKSVVRCREGRRYCSAWRQPVRRSQTPLMISSVSSSAPAARTVKRSV